MQWAQPVPVWTQSHFRVWYLRQRRRDQMSKDEIMSS